MSLRACSHCGHYYVTAGERTAEALCPYCRTESLRSKPSTLQHLIGSLRRLARLESPTNGYDVPNRPGRAAGHTPMWTTQEDGPRDQTLTRTIEETLDEKGDLRLWELVALEDLMAFLEWMELAREVAPSLGAFVERSSPYALQRFTYSQMMRDFDYLSSQITDVAGGIAR